MLLNLVLLFLVFGAEKRKFRPYIAATLFGLLKAIMYVIFSGNFIFALIMGAIYGSLVAGFVFFLKRVDRREASERPETPTYGVAGSEKMKFKWEYVPLTVLLVLIVGGEMILTML